MAMKTHFLQECSMAECKTTSEKILDDLAAGSSFSELTAKYGYSKKDFITAALYGVAELREEYIQLLHAKKRA